MTELTAWDVAELRVWAKSGGFISDGEGDKGYPFVTYGQPRQNDAFGLYYLSSQGRTVAASPSDTVILACLRNERHEPGYMARILSASASPEETLLTPEQRALAASRLRAANLLAAERQAALTAEASRRRSQLHAPSPLSMSLDDLEAL